MASTIKLFCAICFILVRLFFLTGAQGKSPTSFNNATDHESSWTSGRSKRSLADTMPIKLYIRIEYAAGDTSNLVFVKTKHNLANHNLPVDAPVNYLFRDTVMKDVGEFVMYQDLGSSSAIVYFEKLKAIFGVCGSGYYIQGYPLEWHHSGNTEGVVASPYLVKTEGPFFSEMDQSNEQMMNPQAGPSTLPESVENISKYKDYNICNTVDTNSKYDRQIKICKNKSSVIFVVGDSSDEMNIEWDNKQKLTEYYLETLVFISKGITEIYCNVFKDDCINEIIRYYLVYFNAVDLFFQQLRSHGMRICINIAKIVFEDGILTSFDFLNQRDEVQFTDLMSQLPTYLEEHSTEYPPDSFDHVFIVTERSIMLDETTSARALTKSGDDLILARAGKKFHEAVPFTVIRAENFYSGYSRAAEEISQAFSPNIDQLEYIVIRLEWNQNSLNQFKVFFSKNPNRVFYRNKPRSLLPPGPHVLISPNAQCKCFENDHHRKGLYHSTSYVRSNKCLEHLQCNKKGIKELYQIPIWPFDGTLCSSQKVQYNY
ncbi:hypothetical protein PV325_004339 [Microctonus aethiopoides]|nr:hypothetical protein PV325_004339 [Microctonus aethiopoides]